MSEFKRSQPVIHDQLTRSENKSTHIGLTSTTITFSQEINALEIANHSDSAIIYIDYNSPASVNTGIPIYSGLYYSCNRKLQSVSIISDEPNTDVRIIGHFEYKSLN